MSDNMDIPQHYISGYCQVSPPPQIGQYEWTIEHVHDLMDEIDSDDIIADEHNYLIGAATEPLIKALKLARAALMPPGRSEDECSEAIKSIDVELSRFWDKP
jgi:hypothetical protein